MRKEMATKSVLSTKGQIVVPKEIRDCEKWEPGTEMAFEAHPGYVIMRKVQTMPAYKTLSLEEVSGVAKYHGPAITLEETNEGIAKAVKERHARGRC